MGAPQAIDQVHLFGRAVRWFGDPGVPDTASAPRWRAFAGRAYAATRGRPGPVHLNLPFREPLVGTAGRLPPGRGDGPWVAATPARPAATVTTAVEVPDELRGLAGRRGVIVAGAASVDAAALQGSRMPRMAGAGRAPLAGVDPGGHRHRAPRRHPALARAPPTGCDPGDPAAWCARLVTGGQRVAGGVGRRGGRRGRARVVGPGGDGGDRHRRPARRRGGGAALGGRRPRPGALARAVASGLGRGRRAVASTLAQESSPNEPAIARDVVAALPNGARLVVASSMPIRDVERYAAPRHGVTVVANRGANGIDGTVSTAVGLALGSAAPTALLIGDIAFLHDSNGLLGAAGRGSTWRASSSTTTAAASSRSSRRPGPSPPSGSRPCSARPTASTSSPWRRRSASTPVPSDRTTMWGGSAGGDRQRWRPRPGRPDRPGGERRRPRPHRRRRSGCGRRCPVLAGSGDYGRTIADSSAWSLDLVSASSVDGSLSATMPLPPRPAAGPSISAQRMETAQVPLPAAASTHPAVPA